MEYSLFGLIAMFTFWGGLIMYQLNDTDCLPFKAANRKALVCADLGTGSDRSSSCVVVITPVWLKSAQAYSAGFVLTCLCRELESKATWTGKQKKSCRTHLGCRFPTPRWYIPPSHQLFVSWVHFLTRCAMHVNHGMCGLAMTGLDAGRFSLPKSHTCSECFRGHNGYSPDHTTRELIPSYTSIRFLLPACMRQCIIALYMDSGLIVWWTGRTVQTTRNADSRKISAHNRTSIAKRDTSTVDQAIFILFAYCITSKHSNASQTLDYILCLLQDSKAAIQATCSCEHQDVIHVYSVVLSFAQTLLLNSLLLECWPVMVCWQPIACNQWITWNTFVRNLLHTVILKFFFQTILKSNYQSERNINETSARFYALHATCPRF